MESIPVSKFKATCLAVVQRVKRTGRPVLITRFGAPIAEVVPATRSVNGDAWIGSMHGTVEVTGDELAPALAAKRWNALRNSGCSRSSRTGRPPGPFRDEKAGA
jgi:prevent-host-death family protein